LYRIQTQNAHTCNIMPVSIIESFLIMIDFFFKYIYIYNREVKQLLGLLLLLVWQHIHTGRTLTMEKPLRKRNNQNGMQLKKGRNEMNRK
jgi:hypothetical protein